MVPDLPQIETFGAFLKRARGDRPQGFIAELIGVAKSTIASIEDGRTTPRRYIVSRLCRLFGEPEAKWLRVVAWQKAKDPIVRAPLEQYILNRWYGVVDSTAQDVSMPQEFGWRMPDRSEELLAWAKKTSPDATIIMLSTTDVRMQARFPREDLIALLEVAVFTLSAKIVAVS